MSNEREILKTLLLQEELVLLDKLKSKVLSKEQFTQEVSEVLAGAIKRSSKSNNRLKHALKEPINLGIQKAFADNKKSIIDSILPIMGQLIRKTVTNSIKQFVADINRTLEVKFSYKYIKWRLQAMKADISFAEMVFQKTIRYQIEEMFFVDKETGLLIEYAGTDELVKNKDAISSMLTAIQDFIGDSLQLSKSELVSAEIGDNLILITTGPHAYLATVVKGSPTERLKQHLQELVETIHAEFGDEFVLQENFRNLPDLSEMLSDNLVTKSINGSNENRKINWYPWLFMTIAIFSIIFYYQYKNFVKYNKVYDLANGTAGLYVQSIKKTSEGYIIKGLADPLVNLDEFKKLDVAFVTTPFISLEDDIIAMRTVDILSHYSNIQPEYKNHIVTLNGLINSSERIELTQKLLTIPGIKQVIDHTSLDLSKPINDFLLAYKGLINDNELSVLPNGLTISGTMTYENYQLFSKHFLENFNTATLNSDDITISNSNEILIRQINQTSINTNNLINNQKLELTSFSQVVKNLQYLQQRDLNIILSVIGQSDCDSKISDSKSQQRADLIRSKMLERNLATESIQFTINKCESFNNERNKTKLVVTFKISER